MEGCWVLARSGSWHMCCKVYLTLSLHWLTEGCWGWQSQGIEDGPPYGRGWKLTNVLPSLSNVVTPTEGSSRESGVAPGKRSITGACKEASCFAHFTLNLHNFSSSWSKSEGRFGFPLKNCLLGPVLYAFVYCIRLSSCGESYTENMSQIFYNFDTFQCTKVFTVYECPPHRIWDRPWKCQTKY